MEFDVGQVDFVRHLPDGQVKRFREIFRKLIERSTFSFFDFLSEYFVGIESHFTNQAATEKFAQK